MLIEQNSRKLIVGAKPPEICLGAKEMLLKEKFGQSSPAGSCLAVRSAASRHQPVKAIKYRSA